MPKVDSFTKTGVQPAAAPPGEVELRTSDIQVSCAVHVINLIVQAFLHGLGAANVSDPDIEDLYKETRGESLVYNSKDDPEMQEEMEMARDKLVLTCQRKAVLESAEKNKDSDNELKLDDEFSADNKSNQASSAHSRRLKKVQSPVDKIHSSEFSHEHFTDMSHVLAVYHCC